MRDDLGLDTKALIRIRRASRSVEVNKSMDPDASANGPVEKIINHGSSAMPSISESPLEQDFTTQGTPSTLECPFASMDNRKLSSHAASVVSKYRSSSSITPRSSVSRINGRASSVAQASFDSRPLEPEPGLCGALESPAKLSSTKPDVEVVSLQGSTATSARKCPIRNLKNGSPEEVAAYFEEHKHELPRSHEICVKRYQSNAESIKQLDAKYGNLVSMIQGLGQKHVPMLPETPMEVQGDVTDPADDERVRTWARTVSNDEDPGTLVEEEVERLSHFDRPLRDVRIGESPSRPWGIQVPISAIEKASRSSSVAAEAPQHHERPVSADQEKEKPLVDMVSEKPAGKCPFDHGALKRPTIARGTEHTAKPEVQQDQHRPVFINAPTQSQPPIAGVNKDAPQTAALPQMTFTGPVFIGYSVEQATAVLNAMNGR